MDPELRSTSRRDMLVNAPLAGFAALGTSAGIASAGATETTQVARLYAEWKSLFGQPALRTAEEAIVDAMTDRLADLEQRIATTPSASTLDVYRKICIAHRYGAISGADFDTRALIEEARAALGSEAPA